MAAFSDAAFIPEWLSTALLGKFGFAALLPVQRSVIPFVQRALASGMPLDVCLSAPTGSGKTLCYLLPLLANIATERENGGSCHLRGIILVPTKSLGRQVASIAAKLVSGTSLRIGTLCGGQSADEADMLLRSVTFSDGTTRHYSAIDLLVATPQRLLKHLGPTLGFSLAHLRMLVMDEADDVLAGAFTNFASRIVTFYEAERRTDASVLHKMLCSATITPHVAKVADVRLQNVRFFALDGMGETQHDDSNNETDGNKQETASGLPFACTRFALPPNLHEHIVIVDDASRHASLLAVVRHVAANNVQFDVKGKAILVFCAMPETARVIGHFLSRADIATLEFTAMATEIERKRAVLEAFSGRTSLVVVATDALMRGIDMPGVGTVIMYDAPRSLQQYIHRTGRTARANATGHSFVLLSKTGPTGQIDDGEVAHFKKYDRQLKRLRNPVVERELKRLSADVIQEADDCLASAQRNLRNLWVSSAAASGAPTSSNSRKRTRSADDGAKPVAPSNERDRIVT